MRGDRTPELLAPAGTFRALQAAIAAGADAVYFGGKKFSARQLAENFGERELREAIDYCHERGVRAYITVNTLLKESELGAALGYLAFLYESGADAILIQDTGLAHLAREAVPDLPLHASTQMTVHTREGLERLAREGFARAVLPRELPLREVEGMLAPPLPIGLEIFIHGALCFSYSGQCLLSSCMGGRSGNRGVCAQPCRKEYTLLAGEPDALGRLAGSRVQRMMHGHLLSTRDLCTYRYLPEILRLPLTALKIEGRMKSPEYVAIVVDVYRRALDAVRDGVWVPDPEDERRLVLAFSRSFTRGHLLGARHRELVAADAPGHRGLRLGRVVHSDRKGGTITILTEGGAVPSKGDGLLFRSERKGEDAGFVLASEPSGDGERLRIDVPFFVPRGTGVYITRSLSLERWAGALIRSAPAMPGRLALELEAWWDQDRHLVLKGHLDLPGRGPFDICMVEEEPADIGRTCRLSGEEIARCLCRRGDAPFQLRSCRIRHPGDLFVPLSRLRESRRRLLREVRNAVRAAFRPGPARAALVRANTKRITEELRHRGSDGRGACMAPELGVLVDSPAGAGEACREGAEAVYLEIPCATPAHLAASFREAAALSMEGCTSLYWKWPRITRRAFLDEAIHLLPELAASGVEGVMVESPGAAELVSRACPEFQIHGYLGLNLWNSVAVRKHSGLFGLVTLSPELSLQDIRELIRATEGGIPRLGILVQGNLEAAVSEICLIAACGLCSHDTGYPACLQGAVWGLLDGEGRILPLRFGSGCRTYIHNPVETCLVDLLPDLHAMGICTYFIDARGRTAEYVRGITRSYRQVMELLRAEAGSAMDKIPAVKEEIRTIAAGGLTMGPLRAGLKDGW